MVQVSTADPNSREHLPALLMKSTLICVPIVRLAKWCVSLQGLHVAEQAEFLCLADSANTSHRAATGRLRGVDLYLRIEVDPIPWRRLSAVFIVFPRLFQPCVYIIRVRLPAVFAVAQILEPLPTRTGRPESGRC